MNYYIGVDLGSTTSKAIVLDENSKLMGRGLTNTRSNYKVATDVAEQEAKINVRFSFFEEELLKRANFPKELLNRVTEQFELLFRYEQYLQSLLILEEAIKDELGSLSGATKVELASIENDIFQRLIDDAFEIYKEMGKDKSRFFRDIVGSQYMKIAENKPKVFEMLMGLYDKSITKVENVVLGMNIGEMAKRSLDNLSKSIDLGAELEKELNQAFMIGSERPLRIARRVGTGYGRQHLPYPKKQIQSEILCHGLGSHQMFPNTRTVLDIGGQDTKAIQVDENGIVKSFFMNDRCAAGCGRFLGYIADELNISLHELGPLAMQADKRVKIASTCTVFSSVELRDKLSMGEKRENILAGLHRAIVKRAMSLVARSGGVYNEFTFTGGVAKNESVVENLKDMVKENYDDITINVSPDSIYTGALGAALFAMRG